MKIFFRAKQALALVLVAVFSAAAFPVRADGIAWKPENGVILSGGGEKHQIALTFDDGPHPTKTDEILKLLAKYEARATFFVIGVNAAAHPEIVKRTAAAGHEIGNHTDHHKSLCRCTAADAVREVVGASRLLQEITGKKPTLFRPPEGACTKQTVALAHEQGCRVILWNVDTRDWAKTPTDAIVRNVKQNVSDGSILLFHDYTVSGAHTLDALKILLPWLREQGYELVTVSELLG